MPIILTPRRESTTHKYKSTYDKHFRYHKCFLLLSFYLKSLFAAGTYYRVFSLGFRETKHRVAFGTAAIDVRFSVAEHISAELEKITESLIFGSAPCDVPRKHTGKEKIYEYCGKNKITYRKNIDCQRVAPQSKFKYRIEYPIEDKDGRIAPEYHL